MDTQELSHIASGHSDKIHCIDLDYYGKRAATASADGTIGIFAVNDGQLRPTERLSGHEAPVYCTAWSHPVHGNMLASCDAEGIVRIWRMLNDTNEWKCIHRHRIGRGAATRVAWAPHVLGPLVACTSVNGQLHILSLAAARPKIAAIVHAHPQGATCVSWGPALHARGSAKPSASEQVPSLARIARLVTGGADGAVKIWILDESRGTLQLESNLAAHVGWVRDVKWAPTPGRDLMIASAGGTDGQVYIWTSSGAEWTPKKLLPEGFRQEIQDLSWTHAQNVLSVTLSNDRVCLYSVDYEGEFRQL